MKHSNLGSNFDNFLQDEGLLTEAEAVATKRVIAYQISQLMEEQNISKAALAVKLHTSRSSLNRLLDPANNSITLQTLEKAARVLGKRIQISLV